VQELVMPRDTTHAGTLEIPRFAAPRSIFDLLNFRVSEFYNVSGSLVTRLCEGQVGITREEWAFVAMLAVLGQVSPSELAARTTIDRSQCSRTLRSLWAKKLIYRQAVPQDGRRALIGLTPAGEALYQEVFPRVVQVHQAILGALEPAEVEVLARCIWKMSVRALQVQQEGLVDAQADRRHGGSRATWVPPR
jgi:DNA-binding MarR family transcriptional regulator